jgi:hypothetical protein
MMLLVSLMALGLAQPVMLDRLLATVAGQPITLSDVRAARLLRDTAAGLDDERLVNSLVDRELMRTEVERYAVANPPDAAIDERLQAAAARAGGDAPFAAALARAGLSSMQARAIVRDDLRIEAYLDQRFAATSQPTEDEVVSYYRTRHPDATVDLPSAEALAGARRDLARERRQKIVEEWLSGLRRRAEIRRVEGGAGAG